MKTGTVTLIGRPNVGKSSLINALLRTHALIISPKPQTTRNSIRCIYNDDDTAEEALTEVTGIEQAEMILGERNPDDGCFVLPFEAFRNVYRFLKRNRGFYSKMTCLVIFSLKRHKSGSIQMAEAADQFLTVISTTFRQGDAVTQNGNSQFFALMTNADAYRDVKKVTDRIRENWDHVPASTYFTFEYEWKVLYH